jgi:hypothetical protein
MNELERKATLKDSEKQVQKEKDEAALTRMQQQQEQSKT